MLRRAFSDSSGSWAAAGSMRSVMVRFRLWVSSFTPLAAPAMSPNAAEKRCWFSVPSSSLMRRVASSTRPMMSMPWSASTVSGEERMGRRGNPLGPVVSTLCGVSLSSSWMWAMPVTP